MRSINVNNSAHKKTRARNLGCNQFLFWQALYRVAQT